MVANVYPNANFTDAGGVAVQPRSEAAPIKCPRCDSSNTKFCYYNNYSLAQPRHFCRACKRYWTFGGTLRNVPVGGGCRKNKRHKKSQSTSLRKIPDRQPPNSLPIPAFELSSLIYDMQSTNSTNLFFPGSDLDAQFPGYGENFQSGIGSQLDELQLSIAGRESYRVPLLSCEDPAMGIRGGFDFTGKQPMETIYPVGGSGFAGAESAHLSWNQAGIRYDWPE